MENKAGLYLVTTKLEDGQELVKIGYSTDIKTRFEGYGLYPIFVAYEDDGDDMLYFVQTTRKLLHGYEVMTNWYDNDKLRIISSRIYRKYGINVGEDVING